jgi:hypothetical protein
MISIISPKIQNSDNISTSKKEFYSGLMPNAAGSSAGIQINRSIIPKDIPKIDIYEINENKLDIFGQNAISFINEKFPGFSNRAINVSSENNVTIYSTQKESIRLYKTGAYVYENSMDGYDAVLNNYTEQINQSQITFHINGTNESNQQIPIQPSSKSIPRINQSQAFQIAIDFINKHGSLPENYNVTCDIGTISGLQLQQTYPYRYLFTFHKKINGLLIAGGERIRINVYTNGEVSFFLSFFRKITEKKETIDVKSADEASKSLTSITYGNNKPENIYCIEKIELGYYSKIHIETQDKMIPVWIFSYRNGLSQFYINAITLEVI